jgi:hypothetical protein
MMPDFEQDIINDLVDKGALEIVGVDEKTSELLYKVTPKMKEVNEALYDQHQDHVHQETMYLWERGFLEIDVTEDNPIVKLTKKAFDERHVANLPLLKRLALEDIKSILLKK